MSCCCTTKVPLSKRVGEECERCRHATTMQHWSKPAGGLFRFLSLVCSHTLIHSGVTHWVSTQVSFASWMNEWTNEQKPSFPLPRSHPHLHSLLIGASSIWPSHTLQNLADPWGTALFPASLFHTRTLLQGPGHSVQLSCHVVSACS